jgi:hypothetical protein
MNTFLHVTERRANVDRFLLNMQKLPDLNTDLETDPN